VKDTGIGIAMNDLNKLFQPFKQINPYMTRQYGGTGLGLALVKKYVEMHGGKIWVISEVGKGSKFTFTIRY
jgi:signal transduction histidine kinase